MFQKLLPIEKVKYPEKLFPALVSEKYDGVFCCYKNGKILSRTGKEYTSMNHLLNILEDVNKQFDVDVAVLFEAYCPYVGQPTISGWCRDTRNQHREIIPEIHRVWDTETNRQFIFPDDMCLRGFVSPYIVQHEIVNTYQEAMEIARKVWARGGEGIVIDAYPVTLYQPGARNKTCVKVKQQATYDLKVVDVVEGEGKYTGMTGALLCQFGDGTLIACGGMTDEERKIWWNDRSLIVGKIVEIACMKASTKGVLREPRYKSIRHDKEMPDYEP